MGKASSSQSRIQSATLLGNFWELAASHIFPILGHAIESSPDLGKGIIRPDYLLRSQNLAVCVTATASTQTFMRKRWRYINEIFQLKGLFGSSFYCANLIFADPALMRVGGASVLNEIFDATIDATSFPEYEAIKAEASSLLRKRRPVDEVVAVLLKGISLPGLLGHLAGEIGAFLQHRQTANPKLWDSVATWSQKREPTTAVAVPPTFFRRMCLRLLPFTDEQRAAILSCVPKPGTLDTSILSRSSIKHAKAIGDRVRIVDEEFVTTLQNGVSSADIRYACTQLDRRVQETGFPINEIKDPTQIGPSLVPMIECWPDTRRLSALAAQQFADQSFNRVSCLEYVIAAVGISMLEINKSLCE
jgi:hypothetical protein